MNLLSKPKKPSGRPRKFEGPSRVVTLTLPEHTLTQLAQINEDRAKAIVIATEMAAPSKEASSTTVELIDVGQNLALITVPYCEPLQRIKELTLIQISPSRYLLISLTGTPLANIEVSILDQLEHLDRENVRDREILEGVLSHWRSFRKSSRLNTAELIVFSESPA